MRQYLGGGEDSAVFLTEYGPSRQRAALKLVKADPQTADLRTSRWQLAARLSHPHLLRIFTLGRCQLDGSALLYVVMEYAEEDLSQVLPHRPLTTVEAGEMLEPALSALSYLHREGFAHGHLKPSNIMAVNDQLRISSDGLRRIGELDERQTKPGPYDPPEADAGSSPAGDVWSLGVLLVETLTQQLPVWSKAEQHEPILPKALPDPFLDIARHCLQPTPRNRWTASEVAARLVGGAPRSVEPRKIAPKLRYIVPAAALGLAALVILLARGVQSKPSNTAAAPAVQAKLQPEKPAAIPVIRKPPSEGSKTTAGEVVHQVVPEVPRKAKNSIRGKVAVNVKVSVDPSGTVRDVTLDSAESSKYFAGLAMQAARQWRFRPAGTNDREWILRFEFSRTAAKAYAVGHSKTPP